MYFFSVSLTALSSGNLRGQRRDLAELRLLAQQFAIVARPLFTQPGKDLLGFVEWTHRDRRLRNDAFDQMKYVHRFGVCIADVGAVAIQSKHVEFRQHTLVDRNIDRNVAESRACSYSPFVMLS